MRLSLKVQHHYRPPRNPRASSAGRIPICLGGLLILAMALTACGRSKEAPPPAVRSEARQVAPAPTSASGGIPTPRRINAAKPGAPLPLAEYDLKIDSGNLAGLERGAFSNETVPAVFQAGGKTYPVRVRYRGAWARSWPKKPFKIFFEKTNLFEGEHCLNLNSAWHDPAFIREPLAYYVYAACGAPASEARMVRLNVNGQFRGLYVQVQQPDKAFLKRVNLKGASIYKATSQANRSDERDLGSEQAYRGSYEKQTRKDAGYGELQEFCRGLARAGNVLDFCNQHLDVDKYINYLAATALTQNWDGYNKNHVLVYDGEGSRKWLVVPWDLDRTFGDHWQWRFDEARVPLFCGTRQSPGITGWSRLQDKFLSEPTLRARYLDRVAELLETEFTPEKLFPIVDQFQAQIAPHAGLDRRRWPAMDPNWQHGIAQVKQFIEQRRSFLLAEVNRSRSRR